VLFGDGRLPQHSHAKSGGKWKFVLFNTFKDSSWGAIVSDIKVSVDVTDIRHVSSDSNKFKDAEFTVACANGDLIVLKADSPVSRLEWTSWLETALAVKAS
jgi:hypothetical protein